MPPLSQAMRCPTRTHCCCLEPPHAIPQGHGPTATCCPSRTRRCCLKPCVPSPKDTLPPSQAPLCHPPWTWPPPPHAVPQGHATAILSPLVLSPKDTPLLLPLSQAHPASLMLSLKDALHTVLYVPLPLCCLLCTQGNKMYIRLCSYINT